MAQVLRQLPTTENHPQVLIGTDTSDDGGVYKLSDEVAMIQSLDYFTPIVDDPYTFGQIAASNALSDIYAMGGKPVTALNMVGYPIKALGPDPLAQILKGASEKVIEAGAVTLGGHSIDDPEPKFGMAVTGIAHPKNIYANIGAKPGDYLVLTKPLGVGIQTTAIKRDELSDEQTKKVSHIMAKLNKIAAETLVDFSPSAVTDVTGFGLLGHGYEMASGSDVTFKINYKNVPILDGTHSLAEAGVVPGGTKKNLKWLADTVQFHKTLKEYEQFILADAITSGGLLVALPKNEAEDYVQALANKGERAAIIGKVVSKRNVTLEVE